MAHGRDGPDIVMNIRYVGQAEVAHVSRHETARTPDGPSAIDPARSHLNRVLIGPATQSEALAAMISNGVRPQTAQAESPFVQIVLSASPAYFRAEGQGQGEWDERRMRDWTARTLRWLRREHGRDVSHVSLHLDEDTPHLHVLIVPTYARAARKPGRQKRNETHEAFEARKAAAAAAPTVRTIGRASSEKWGDVWSKLESRRSYHAAVESLGLGYGRDFVGSGDPSPVPTTTGEWVRSEASRLRDESDRIERDRRESSAAADAIRAKAAIEARAASAAFAALAREIEGGTLRMGKDGKPIVADTEAVRPGGRAVFDAAAAVAPLLESARRDRSAAAEAWSSADAAQAQADAAKEEALGLLSSLRSLLGRLRAFMRRPDLPAPARAEADSIASDPLASLLAEEPAEDAGFRP